MGKVALKLNGKPLVLVAPPPDSVQRMIAFLKKLPYPHLKDINELSREVGVGRSTIVRVVIQYAEELAPYTHAYRPKGLPAERAFGCPRSIAELRKLVGR